MVMDNRFYIDLGGDDPTQAGFNLNIVLGHVGKNNLLLLENGLTDQSLAENHHRIPVFFSQRECHHGHLSRFLNTGRGQDQHPIIPVTTSFNRLVIVGLGR